MNYYLLLLLLLLLLFFLIGKRLLHFNNASSCTRVPSSSVFCGTFSLQCYCVVLLSCLIVSACNTFHQEMLIHAIMFFLHNSRLSYQFLYFRGLLQESTAHYLKSFTCFIDGVSLSKFQVFVLNQIFPFFFGISSSGLAYDGKSMKISQILRFRLIYLYRLNRYLGKRGQIFLVSSLSITFRTTIFPLPHGVFVFTRAARDLVIRPIMPTDLVLESEAYLNTWFAISNLSLVFCLDFMAFGRLPSQPNVVLDLFYSLHPS